MKNWGARLKWVVGFLVASWALWAPSAAAQASESGYWGPLVTWPISATHTHVLPTGKVFFIGEFDEGFLPHIWDPVTDDLTEVTPPHYNVFCSGHSFLADGRLLISGGHMDSHVGEPYAAIFNPFTAAWEHVPDMNDRRWYPTNTTLPNGDVVVLSGETVDSGASNELPQRWDAASGTWKDLTTAMKDLPYYPRVFVAPNGKLLYVGPGPTSHYLDPEGTGTWFETVGTNFGDSRTYGGAVMFDNKILLVGGGDPPTNTVELLDLNSAAPRWQSMAPMSVARRQHNTTLLPDGTVLVTGGSSGAGFNNSKGAVYLTELYDPATNTWSALANSSAFRGYHSTTVLLPDGRVLSAGGRAVHSAQVFSPPYLFKGPRPTIASAPDVLTPGTRFFVSTPESGEIQKVTLIAMGSVTHAFDQNQRLLTLNFAQAGGGLSVNAPVSNIAAPPGPYMLFLVNAQGVPSVAKIVRVEAVRPKGVRLINFSDEWKYDASNVDLGTAWLARDYDDSAWLSGPGQLGFGDEDEGTVLSRTTPSQPSVYFRKKFTLDAPITAARLEVLHDDGVQVWINGVPVFSRYMAGGVSFSTYATASTSNEYSQATLSLSPNPFVVGENVITAMVKQVSGSSDDLTFALGLEVEKLDVQSSDSVHVVAPNGGEFLDAGHMATVSWICTGEVGTVDLSYSKDLGATWLPIASGVDASAGSYSWMVPDVRTTQGLVRISKTGGAQRDESDAPFTINREVRLQPITFGSEWKYQDNGLDPGASWNQASFDDSAWRSGVGQLGYGDKDEGTLLTRSSPSQTSVYFRKKINLPSMVMSASLRVLFDDGVVVYVNGVQVFSRNVNNTAHTRYATESTDNLLETVDLTLSPNPFVVGENTIAVIVKQVGATSPDLSFDLGLEVGVMAETRH
jgi:galactose oxidase